jgi:DNA damage-binding protein 1
MSIMSKEKYKKFFIDHMMIQELGMEVPDPDDSPAKAGLAMFIAFILFGGLPLYPYVFFALIDWHNNVAQFILCCISTVASLFLLGVLQVSRRWWRA